jgi:hypothetical protein
MSQPKQPVDQPRDRARIESERQQAQQAGDTTRVAQLDEELRRLGDE